MLTPEIEARGIWLDDFDVSCRHWIVRDPRVPSRLLASARLTSHGQLLQSPDGAIWKEHGRMLPEPVGNLGKLVVRREARRIGLASRLNAVRISAARAMGIRSLTVTASYANARLLLGEGFHDTGWVVHFGNRPEVPFQALELLFPAPGVPL